MKNLSLVDNNWIERVNPSITVEERAALQNRTMPPSESDRSLLESIKARALRPADAADAAAAQTLYDQHKLADATLISVDITLPAGKGLINCRVNGEHKQIRF